MRPGGGALVISLDFELFWGMRDVVTLDAYRANVQGVHEAVPRMLDLFATYEVHATWACVGLVLAQDRDEARRFAPALRPSYLRRGLSPFDELERPDLDGDAHCYFAPHLVRQIGARPHQEIATHTFSHFYCTEPGQSADEFEADLRAAIAISQEHGHRPTSIVFPRNQVNSAYLPLLRRHGIRAYRGVPRAWALGDSASRLGTAVRRGARLADNYAPIIRATSTPRRSLRGDPLDIPGSRFLRPYSTRLRRLDPLREHRIRHEMKRAAEAGHIYHLWWHPHNFGRHMKENLAFLERLLCHARILHGEHGFSSLNMAEVAEHHEGA